MGTEKEIKERMLSNISDDYDKSNGSFIYDALAAGAVILAEKQQEIISVSEKLDIEKLTGEDLERFVFQRTGISKKQATKATTSVVISGTTGSFITVGDLVSTGTLNFISLETKTLSESGVMTVLIECEEFGNIGNVPANTINVFPVTIQGLISVSNPYPVSNGYEAESDSELRVRYYDKLQRPGKAGNRYHYEEWAKEVTGVGDARCIPRWDGPLTVKVVIIDSNKQPASIDLVQNVSEHIEKEMPFGASLTVISAMPLSISLEITITLVDGYDLETVTDSIGYNITSYLREIAFKETYVSYARIGSIIIDTEGVLDYQNLLVNGGIANIFVGDEEVAVMGSVLL